VRLLGAEFDSQFQVVSRLQPETVCDVSENRLAHLKSLYPAVEGEMTSSIGSKPNGSCGKASSPGHPRGKARMHAEGNVSPRDFRVDI
jgi:hypothetical protein